MAVDVPFEVDPREMTECINSWPEPSTVDHAQREVVTSM